MAIEVDRLVAEIDANPSGAVAALKTFDKMLDRASKNRHSEIDVDVDDAFFSMLKLESTLDTVTRDRSIKIDVDRSKFGAIMNALGGIGRGAANAASNLATMGMNAMDAAADMGSGAGKGGMGLAGAMGGAASAGAILAGSLIGIVQAFIPLMLMAAAFGSVLPGAFASAAAGAGVLLAALAPLVGLVGALVPAIAALGVVGTTLFAGLSGVFSGVSAYKGAQEGAAAATEDMTAKQRALTAALQGVEDAQQGVIRATEALREAREDLANAPHEAAEALEDQRRASAQAALDEKKAILALHEAQKNLTAAQNASAKAGMTLMQQTDEFTGKVYDVAYASTEDVKAAGNQKEARLALQQAELDLAAARDHSQDEQRALNQMERKGIKNSDIMVDARRKVRDAEWALADAREGLRNANQRVEDAQKSLNERMTEGTAATDAWRDSMERLSPVGIQFVKFLADEFMPALSDIGKGVQDAMLPGIEDGLRSLMGVFDEVEEELSIVGEMIGTTFSDFMDFWTRPKQQQELERMFRGLNRVIQSGLDLIRPFSRVLVNIADSASPMLVTMLDSIGDKLQGIADWMDTRSGSEASRKFFEDAAYFGGLWLDVLRPIGGIFKAIANAAKPLAEKWLVTMAEKLQSVSDYLNSKPGQNDIISYIERQIPSLQVFWDVLSDIGEMLFGTSKGGKDSAFYKMLVAIRDDLLPPIRRLLVRMEDSTFTADLVKDFGALVKVLEKIDWEQLGQDFHEISNALRGMSKWMGRIADLQGSFGGVLGTLNQQSPLGPKGESVWEDLTSLDNPFRQFGGEVEKKSSYIVGEKGPELFTPSTSGRIMPTTPTKMMMESTGSGISADEMERVLDRVLAKAKPDVTMNNEFREKVDPKHLSEELAWSLR
jgi:hypothetical protein